MNNLGFEFQTIKFRKIKIKLFRSNMKKYDMKI